MNTKRAPLGTLFVCFWYNQNVSKLIIIRGQSGSGKSTVAKAVRDRSSGKTALVEQDYLRRHLLGERGKGGDDNVELINLTTRFALANNYIVILEGIMPSEYYGAMLRGLIEDFTDSCVYYIDVSLEETLIRHQSKPNKDEFGEKEMTEWYRAKDFLNSKNEEIVPETMTEQEIVDLICKRASHH